MANNLDGDRLWILDTVGLISESPVFIKQIIYIPSAAADDVLIKTYTNTEVATGGYSNISGTTSIPDGTSCRLVVASAYLPAAVADSYVWEMTATSGDQNNKGKYLVKTAGNNTQADFWGQFDTAETKLCSWKTYTSRTAIVLKAGASDASPITLEDGWSLDNFILETIDGGTLYIYLM